MVKTTVILRDDLYEILVRKHGRRKISETINRVLEKNLLKSKKSMFGVDPWLDTKDLRDEEEHEGL
jgi:predicted CopG family antitoxin